jgi:NSS family neurotransmitter:Na+ symporter
MEQRGQWSSRLGFILAAAGSAVGLGNLWKFPYITFENDGGAFVLVYLACILAVGLPIMMAEILIGRRTQRNAVGAMREGVGPRWAWVGGLGVLTGFILLGYYNVVAGWTTRYFVTCLKWSLGTYVPGSSSPEAFGAFAADGGTQVGLAALFMAFTIGVVGSGVSKGIERAAKLLLPMLLGIMVIMLINALRMPGAGEALRFIFRPSFDELTTHGALEALGHSFFTLSLGMGAMITYGSYMSREDSVVRASGMVVLLDTAIALLATIIMFSVIFSQAGLADSIGRSTAGMLFITLPELFYTMVPLGGWLAPLFYILVGFAALTSTVSLLEVIVAYFIDEHGWSRRRSTLLCGLGCFALSILCALSLGAVTGLSTIEVFSGKSGLFDTLDHLVSNWLLPVGGLLVTLAAGWFMSTSATREELEAGDITPFFRYRMWQFFIRFVSPVAVAIIIIAVLLGRADFT